MTIVDDLKQALGDIVLTGAAVGERHRSDASLTGRDLPKAVIRPTSSEEIATALRLCNENNQSIVVQGGLTGLAGEPMPAVTRW